MARWVQFTQAPSGFPVVVLAEAVTKVERANVSEMGDVTAIHQGDSRVTVQEPYAEVLKALHIRPLPHTEASQSPMIT
jgi:hypothetical protein